MESFTCTVEEGTTTNRLDRILTTKLPHYSRSYFQELITEKQVLVNGAVITKSSWPIRAGDSLQVTFPPVRPIGALPLPSENMGVSILFEHEEFLIVFKPAGLVVHAPHIRSTEVTLVDWLVHSFKDLATVGSQDRPGIVHRLDKDTSGLMVIPRNNHAHALFSLLFQQRTIEKNYLAFVVGHPAKKGIIDHPIGRDPMQPHKMAHIHSGRAAQSGFEVEQYYAENALVRVQPLTGRTHQIRLHLATLGHPVMGDKIYGTEDERMSRHALHAYQLSFTYKDRWYSFTCSMPKDMQDLGKLLHAKL